MTFKYRCSRCRTRNTFKRELEDYVRTKRCRDCGHAHFYWDRERNGRRPICGCDSYHYTHRRGSRLCRCHPLHEVHERVRQGEDFTEALIDASLANRIPGYTGAQPPF